MGFLGLIPTKLAYLPMAWGLVEAPLGTLAGAWVLQGIIDDKHIDTNSNWCHYACRQ